MPKISVVVVALNEADHLKLTVEGLLATLPDTAEIIVVDDGSEDGCADFLLGAGPRARLIRAGGLGAPRARNRGAREANGEILVFCDAHITVPAGWWRPITELLSDPRVGAVSPAIADVAEPERKGFGLRLNGPDLGLKWLRKQSDAPYQVPLLPAGCWAMRRDLFAQSGCFDDGMICAGPEGTELSIRLWLLGYELWLTPQVEVNHFFRKIRPYHFDPSWVIYNRLRVAFSLFAKDRVARVVEALRKCQGFTPSLALAAENDSSSRRAEFAARRVHDDSWFFERFTVGW